MNKMNKMPGPYCDTEFRRAVVVIESIPFVLSCLWQGEMEAIFYKKMNYEVYYSKSEIILKKRK